MHILSQEPQGPSFPGKWFVRPPFGLGLPVPQPRGVGTETLFPTRANLLGGNQLHEKLSLSEPVLPALKRVQV